MRVGAPRRGTLDQRARHEEEGHYEEGEGEGEEEERQEEQSWCV